MLIRERARWVMAAAWKYRPIALAVLPVVAFALAFVCGRPAEPHSLPDVVADQNAACLSCHRSVIEETAGKAPDRKNIHQVHLTSENQSYQDQKRCVTCHEMWKEEDVLTGAGRLSRAGFVHPETAERGCKRLIRRPSEGVVLGSNVSFRNTMPYTFKPSLARLRCIECHGQDSKTGLVFYGKDSDTWRIEGQAAEDRE
ncbi:MAG: hypothetical protein HY720_24540 [Planctomycetes bacterium]|nr:hypothetical protein [Planctomycetota bacterium]